MIAELQEDKQYIELKFASEHEMMQAQDFFRRRVKNYYIMRKKFRNWNGETNYLIDKRRIRATLWSRLVELCDKYGFDLQMIGFDGFIRENITYEFVEKFCKSIMRDHETINPYPDQIDAVYQAIRNRYSVLEIATSGGKTLIIYLYMMLLRYLKLTHHILIIAPDPNLVIQNYTEFTDYACGKYELKIGLISSNSKDKRMYQKFDHIMGNFASLVNLPSEFFQKFDTVICDEAHRSVAKSIRDILSWCGTTTNLMGCTGSLPKNKEDAEMFTIENNFGAVAKVIKKVDLIKKGTATNITIKRIDIKFATQEELLNLASEKEYIDDGERALRYEQQFIRNHAKLLEWKCQLIVSLHGNTLVYFLDKKGNYGKKIYERVRELNFTRNLGKTVYYIDGDTAMSTRDVYKEKIREDISGQSILIANYNVFSTGQSIKNLINVVSGESIKSDIMLNQSSGRLLRMIDGKTMSYYYDLIENTNVRRYNKATEREELKRCFMVNWSKTRLEYYKDEQLIIENYEVDITGRGSTTDISRIQHPNSLF